MVMMITIVFRKALSWMSRRYDNCLEIAISISRYLATTYSLDSPGTTGALRPSRKYVLSLLCLSFIALECLAGHGGDKGEMLVGGNVGDLPNRASDW